MVTELEEHRDEILRIAERHGAYNVRVFGSTVRGDATPESDVDLLVEMEQGRTLYDFVALQQEIEEALGRSVDLVTEPSLHWFLRERVLREVEPL